MSRAAADIAVFEDDRGDDNSDVLLCCEESAAIVCILNNTKDHGSGRARRRPSEESGKETEPEIAMSSSKSRNSAGVLSSIRHWLRRLWYHMSTGNMMISKLNPLDL